MKKAQKHFVIKPPRLDARTLKALLPYIAIALLATKLGQAYRMTSGADVSREGVQRDILPIVEGSVINTKYGPVRTDHILFIGAAF